MTWNVAHNFPGAKDTYEVPKDYPDVGYDTIIAAWFTDVFTSIFAMQDVLIGEAAIFLLKAGGTMTGDLVMGTLESPNELKFNDDDYSPRFFAKTVALDLFLYLYDQAALYIRDDSEEVDIFECQFEYVTSHVLLNAMEGIYLPADKTVDGINLKLPVWAVDVEVSNKTKGFILKSPNDSRFRIEVSDGGVLSTEAL